MISDRDGHVRILPLHVANKIAAGEVVERPASVVKELMENAIDAGARTIRVTVVQGGRKLVSVQDDGCGMNRDDALLSLERQATSKILDVDDIERIDTLGFRGEAIPSIASVSRFSMSTRRADADEGTFIQVNAGTVAEVRATGCPPGTLVEVRDLFCNVPARRKFLRSGETEEGHVRTVFTVHALAHPAIGFTLTIDGREVLSLAAAGTLDDRVRELFPAAFTENLLKVDRETEGVRVSGFIERPGVSTLTRHEQYIFVNGRPATAPAIQYALREAFPHAQGGSTRPAAVLFLELSPSQVDVNVHPTKREVRFRNSGAVKTALCDAIADALAPKAFPSVPEVSVDAASAASNPISTTPHIDFTYPVKAPEPEPPREAPIAQDLPFALNPQHRLWNSFRYLASSDSGYLLIETDAGLVLIRPAAARERIAFEHLRDGSEAHTVVSQKLLIPETVQLPPPDFARLTAGIEAVRSLGYELESFGKETFKIEAVPQLLEGFDTAATLTTLAHDLGEPGAKRTGERWREELLARSLARLYGQRSVKLTPELATKLVEELAGCRLPYVTPRGKPVLWFLSSRELERRFGLA